jgi:hypothetical protein
MGGSTRGGGGTSLDEMHHISIHDCGSYVLGGGRRSHGGLTDEFGGFRGKSSDLRGICIVGGTKGDTICAKVGMIGSPWEGNVVGV